MSPVTYFTHLLGLWRVVLSADFKERKLVAVVVVHPFTEVVTDVESPAGSENGQRNTFMSQCCFGLVIIKKISKSSPTSSDCKVAVILCESHSSLKDCRVPFPTLLSAAAPPCAAGEAATWARPFVVASREKAITHSMFCFVCILCMCYSTRASRLHASQVTCSVLHGEDLKGLKGAGRRDFWVICSVSQKWATHEDKAVQKHKHIVVFSSTTGHHRLSLAFILCALSSLPSSAYITAAVNVSTD